jgi:hypothetical protein
MRATASLFVFLGLLGCTPFPEIDAPLPADADRLDYPALIPLDTVEPSEDELDTQATENALNARVAALRERADALRARPIE